MNTNGYNVIFEGNIVPGTTIEEVKKKLRSVFKGSDERFDRIFSELPVVLVKDVDYESAMKYKRILEKTGAFCKVERFTAPHTLVSDNVIPDHHERRETEQISLPQEFHAHFKVKIALIASSALLVVLIGWFLWFKSTLSSEELPVGAVLFDGLIVAGAFALIGFCLWSIKKPLVYISENGIEVRVFFGFGCKKATWNEIDGMVVFEEPIRGVKGTLLKIVLKTEGSGTKEILFNLKVVEKGEEIVKILKARIPERTHEEVQRSARVVNKGYESIEPGAFSQRSVPEAGLKYKGITLTENGLKQKGQIIPWKSIKTIRCPGLVIAGYPQAMITYADEEGPAQNLTIRPETSETYQQVVSYLLGHATHASIDPGLAKILEYSPKDARTDLGALALLLSGVILLIISTVILMFYSPSPAASWVYPLLVIPLGIAPLAMAIKLLVSRYRGRAASPHRKLLFAFLSNVGALVSVLILLVTVSGSSSWIMGDVYAFTGNPVRAEECYLKTLEAMPENSDVLFCLGQLYREREDYEKAFHYLERSFQADPSNWVARALMLLPNSLMKCGRYDEALAWCDKISEEYPKREDVARAVRKKRKEIESRKPVDDGDF